MLRWFFWRRRQLRHRWVSGRFWNLIIMHFSSRTNVLIDIILPNMVAVLSDAGGQMYNRPASYTQSPWLLCPMRVARCTTGPQVTLDHHDIIPSSHELNNKRSCNVKCLCNYCCILFDLANGNHVKYLHKKNDCGIATIITRFLLMFPDCIIEYLAAWRNSIELDLLGAKNELGHWSQTQVYH